MLDMHGVLLCACGMQGALQDSVLDDFKLLLGPSDVQLSADNTERLSSACLVVNALGPKVCRQQGFFVHNS